MLVLDESSGDGEVNSFCFSLATGKETDEKKEMRKADAGKGEKAACQSWWLDATVQHGQKHQISDDSDGGCQKNIQNVQR